MTWAPNSSVLPGGQVSWCRFCGAAVAWQMVSKQVKVGHSAPQSKTGENGLPHASEWATLPSIHTESMFGTHRVNFWDIFFLLPDALREGKEGHLEAATVGHT